MTDATDFLVDKDDIQKFSHGAATLDGSSNPEAGEVLMKVDEFAFTANNITYAAFGNSHLKYWDFFPAEANWGRIPVWGFADVVASSVDGVEVGERFYGYYPMSSYLMVHPSKVSNMGFSDGSDHRSHLSPIYNFYNRTTADPAYSKGGESLLSLFRPLFMTSFLIEDFLRDNDYFGAETIILSSASSKTAFGAAFQLMQERGSDGVRIIGLTSKSNISFVEKLGCYDTIIAYEDIETLNAAEKAVFVDMAGSGDIRSRIHSHFDSNLTYSCSVGASHWESERSTADLKGPTPNLFFAPAQGQKRTQEWGQAKFHQVSGTAWVSFISQAKDWITVEKHSGIKAIEEVYAEMTGGKVDPKVGHILSF